MQNAGDGHAAPLVVYFVEDSVIADPESPDRVIPGQLHGVGRSRIVGEGDERFIDA